MASLLKSKRQYSIFLMLACRINCTRHLGKKKVWMLKIIDFPNFNYTVKLQLVFFDINPCMSLNIPNIIL